MTTGARARAETAPPTGAVRLRELGSGEFDVLDTVLAGLSPTSRYHRFHASLPRLTPRTRERLAAVDRSTHLAVAAFAGATPVGIARLVTVSDGRGELAVEVVDAWQRHGIGARLVRAVTALGRARGIREVVADILAENLAAQMLFAVVFPTLTFVEAGPVIRFTAVLTDNDVSASWAA